MKGAVIVMDLEVLSVPDGEKGKLWRGLLARVGLEADEAVEETALLWEGGALVAAASRQGEVLKCIAVSPDRQGEGLLPLVLTPLRQGAFQSGIRRLFLYTKPETAKFFADLGFFEIAQVEGLSFLENRRLDTWVHNKTIQKAVESYRVTDERKSYLRTLRRKGEG